jgi:hypothetical protein
MIDQGDLSGSPANGAVQAVEGLLHLAGPPGFLGGPRFLSLGWGRSNCYAVKSDQ